MKLFPGVIFFFLGFIASVSGQVTYYIGNPSGAYEDDTQWSNGHPTASKVGIVLTGATFQSNSTSGVFLASSVNTYTITLTSPQQYAQALEFRGQASAPTGTGAGAGNGTINFQFGPSSILTISGTDGGTGLGLYVSNGATLNYSGGTIQVTQGNISVGDSTTGTGITYGGTFVPDTGTGTMNITSGALDYSDGLYVGTGSTSVGAVNQSGASTVQGDFLYVGTDGGTGTYTIAGTSALTENTEIILGSGTGSVGTLTQTGGSISEPANTFFEIGAGGTGTYNLAGGSANVYDVLVGESGTGTINQTGGNLIASNEMIVGNTGNGTYNLSGGSATLGELILGSAGGTSGTLNQSASTMLLVTGTATIGGSGTGLYNISGGGATFDAGLAIGTSTAGSRGTVTQSGGTVTIPTGEMIDLTHPGNSYNLNGGLLSIGAGGLAGVAGDGTFNFGGGTLDASASLTDALNGTLSGNSVIESPGIVTLTGVLSGVGALTVVGGTLEASTANLPQTSGVNVGSGATFDLTTSGTTTDYFSGSVSGAGSLETGNPGVANNGTAIPAPPGYRIVIGTVNLPNGTTTIEGTTGLEVGSGTINSLTGGVGTTFEVGGRNGTVTLLSTASVPSITVDSGSTLAAGSIAGDVTSTGTLMTLTPEGMLAITAGAAPSTGNLNMPMEASVAQEGTLVVRTNGTAADTYTANSGTLYGTVHVTGVGSNSYEIVRTAPGALTTGTLNSATPGGLATAPNLPLFTSTLSYVLQTGPNTAGGLELTTVQSNLSPFAQTNNQRAVGAAIDTVIQHPPASFVPLLLAINTLYPSSVPDLLDQLSPRGYLYMRDISFENSTFLAQKVDGFLAHLREGFSGVDTSGLSILTPGLDSDLGRSLGSLLAYNNEGVAPNGVNYYPVDPDAPVAPNAGPGESEGPAGPGTISDSGDPHLAPTVAPAAPTSVFNGNTSGFNEFISGDLILADLNQNSGNNEPKAHYTAGNATAGISFRMSSNLAAGVLFDYNHTDARTDSLGSHIRVDSYSPGLFATFFEHGFYANGLFTFGYNNYSNNRNLSFGGTSASATSNPNGEQYVGDLDFGYDFHPNQHWTVGPTLGLEYTHLDVDSFHETGAGVADLGVNSQSGDSLRGRIGARAVYLARAGQVLFEPNLTIAYQREFLDDPFNLTSQFDIPGTPAFGIQGSNPGRNSALIGLGLTATLDNSMALYLDYLAEVGGDDYFVQSVEGGVKASF